MHLAVSCPALPWQCDLAGAAVEEAVAMLENANPLAEAPLSCSRLGIFGHGEKSSKPQILRTSDSAESLSALPPSLPESLQRRPRLRRLRGLRGLKQPPASEGRGGGAIAWKAGRCCKTIGKDWNS